MLRFDLGTATLAGFVAGEEYGPPRLLRVSVEHMSAYSTQDSAESRREALRRDTMLPFDESKNTDPVLREADADLGSDSLDILAPLIVLGGSLQVFEHEGRVRAQLRELAEISRVIDL